MTRTLGRISSLHYFTYLVSDYLDTELPGTADMIIAAPTLFNHMRRQRRKVFAPRNE